MRRPRRRPYDRHVRPHSRHARVYQFPVARKRAGLYLVSARTPREGRDVRVTEYRVPNCQLRHVAVEGRRVLLRVSEVRITSVACRSPGARAPVRNSLCAVDVHHEGRAGFVVAQREMSKCADGPRVRREVEPVLPTIEGNLETIRREILPPVILNMQVRRGVDHRIPWRGRRSLEVRRTPEGDRANIEVEHVGSELPVLRCARQVHCHGYTLIPTT
jgi:hypothetical protein